MRNSVEAKERDRMTPNLIEWFLIGGWLAGACAVAVFVGTARSAFVLGLLLAVPAISYSTYRHGFLEFGGLLHALMAGAYAAGFYRIIRFVRSQKGR